MFLLTNKELSSESCLLGHACSKTAEGTAGPSCFGRAAGRSVRTSPALLGADGVTGRQRSPERAELCQRVKSC